MEQNVLYFPSLTVEGSMFTGGIEFTKERMPDSKYAVCWKDVSENVGRNAVAVEIYDADMQHLAKFHDDEILFIAIRHGGLNVPCEQIIDVVTTDGGSASVVLRNVYSEDYEGMVSGCVQFVAQHWDTPMCGVVQNPELFSHCLKDAYLGSSDAQVMLATLFLLGGAYPESKEWFEIASKNGDAEANVNLGCFYYYGSEVLGIKKDIAKSLELVRRAAESGENPEVKVSLSQYYINGDEVEKDVEKGRAMIMEAIDEGVTDSAYYNLAYLYASGELGEVDAEKTAEYFNKVDPQYLKDMFIFEDIIPDFIEKVKKEMAVIHRVM